MAPEIASGTGRPIHTVGPEATRLSASHPVRAERLWVGEDVAWHDHLYTEICLVEAGTVRHFSPSGEDHLGSGTVVVVPPGPAHAFQSPSGLRVTNVYYLAEWFLWDLNLLWQNEGMVPLFFAATLFARARDRHLSLFRLNPEEMAACARELDDILRLEPAPAPSLLWLRGAFSKLLVILAGAWRRNAGNLNDCDFRPEVWLVLEGVESAIKAGELFSVAACARRAAVSPDGLTRLFREATGLTPSAYFGARRVQHAGHLLLQSRLTVTEIAGRLGYADTAHFSRSFSRVHGCSPRAYRRRYRMAGSPA